MNQASFQKNSKTTRSITTSTSLSKNPTEKSSNRMTPPTARRDVHSPSQDPSRTNRTGNIKTSLPKIPTTRTSTTEKSISGTNRNKSNVIESRSPSSTTTVERSTQRKLSKINPNNNNNIDQSTTPSKSTSFGIGSPAESSPSLDSVLPGAIGITSSFSIVVVDIVFIHTFISALSISIFYISPSCNAI